MASCCCVPIIRTPLISSTMIITCKSPIMWQWRTPASASASASASSFQSVSTATSIPRRSGNYQPCIWDDTFLQSLNNPYAGEIYGEKTLKMIGTVRTMLNDTDGPSNDHKRLELIDSLERLGLAYHFASEIDDVLEHIYNNTSEIDGDVNRSLHTTALKFRLLRDHGYYVSQDIFNSFMDKNGGLEESHFGDVKGVLSLYEASFYGMEGESLMDGAMDVTTKCLKGAEDKLDDKNLVMQVKHALEVPLRKKMERLEARWCIEAFERIGDTDPILIELAKLDYNRVQALFQAEVKDVSRWWKKSNVGVSLSFVRDRVVASYLWGVGIAKHPQFGNCRRMLGEAVLLITFLDDVYDVYGTLEELQLFTDAIERWDVLDAMKRLPDYMKIAYLVLFNWVQEKAYDVLVERGCYVVSYLKNAWLRLLRAYLVEAKWYHAGYRPTLAEYMDNACVSITAPTLAIMCYVLVNDPIVEKDLQFIESLPDVLKYTSSIIRLEDDLGTSSDELRRGDVSKAVQCYMQETGASEEAAREHIRQLAGKAWKKLNKLEFEDIPLSRTCVQFMLDFSRVAHFFYRHGDGHGVQDYLKEMASNVLFDPILPLDYNDIDGAA